MDRQPIKSSRILSSGRRPQTDERQRVCADPTCQTVLSRYNKKTVCHGHSGVRFPRVRGAS